MKKISLIVLCTLFTSNSYTNIFDDVHNKNKAALLQRLENCENCALKDGHGNNALHIAAQNGDTEIIDILTTTPTYNNWSDWFYACFYTPTLPSIDEQNDDGESPLHCATENKQLATAKQLVQKGARIDTHNKQGLSPAFLAVLKDDPRFIRMFVAHNLNLAQHKRHNGDTIFHTAIKEKKTQTITYCAQETSLHIVANNDHKTPTFLAIDTDDNVIYAFTNKQLNDPSPTGMKPIHYATRLNKYNAINYFINNNIASINEPDAQGNPPLFYANNEKTLHFLRDHKADLEKRNNTGENALAFATHNKNLALVAALTQHVDINGRDNKGQTPLMSAAIAQQYEMMDILINSEKVNIRITDNAKETVLHKAARMGDQKAAKIVLNREKALLTDLNKNGDSPLFVAVQNGHIACAEFLLNEGSYVNTINNEGDNIIHELVKKGNHNGLLNRLLNKIDHNLIDHKNKKGKSPICLAAKNDAIDSLKLLMAHKAHIYAVDNDGNNIAHIAAENGSLKTLAFLQQSQQELLRSINNNGETPFVYGAKQGKLETIKLLLNENHFINGELITTINAMKNKYYLWDNERQTYDFLVQQHNNRLIECQNIVAIAQAACNLVTENNNLSKTLSEKTFLRPYHPESLYSYYSENDLYKMTQVERNKVKNIYLERQNRELMTKNTLEQKLHTIAIEEQRKEQARINQQKQTESERIATQQGTTIAAQKAELERIAADKYAADIAAHNKRVEEEKSRVAQPIIPKEYLNYPVQENENEQSEKSENNEQQISCCICYDEDPQLLRKIPCKNTHSDHICGACLKAPSVKTCPICRGPLTK